MKNNPWRFNQANNNSVYFAITYKSGFKPWREVTQVGKIWISGAHFGKIYSESCV